MYAPRLKLSVALVCLVILSSCGGLPGCWGGLPIGFERMSEQERLKIGSDALLASCVESDVETPMTFRERLAFQRAKEYLDYVATVARVGELSKYVTNEAQTACLSPNLEGPFAWKARLTVYRFGSDIEVMAALNTQYPTIQRQEERQEVCNYVQIAYPLDVKIRISKAICSDLIGRERTQLR
jgi:hypothetical protein